MPDILADPGSFRELYRARARGLARLSEQASASLTPEVVHDLRVTSRRLQAMHRLLPKATRASRESKAFEAAVKDLLKSTSRVRDADTLLKTLETFRDHIPPSLFDSLHSERDGTAEEARLSVRRMADARPPRVGASAVDGGRLSKRLGRRLSRRAHTVQRLLAAALDDESDVARLHELRKEVKKLRYLLELTGKAPEALSTLTRWQDSLGAIRDLDVALEFVAPKVAGPAGGIVRELSVKRRSGYASFSKASRREAAGVLHSVGV